MISLILIFHDSDIHLYSEFGRGCGLTLISKNLN
jgi:hypothetical protein